MAQPKVHQGDPFLLHMQRQLGEAFNAGDVDLAQKWMHMLLTLESTSEADRAWECQPTISIVVLDRVDSHLRLLLDTINPEPDHSPIY